MTQAEQEQLANTKLSVRYYPSAPEVVQKMMELGEVSKRDTVFELGCGDGRIAIAAALRGAIVHCVELNPRRIADAKANARKAGVLEKIRFRQESFYDVDLSSATVVTMFLQADVHRKLRPKLERELKKGTRVVSHDHDMPGWEAKTVVQVFGDTYERPVYLWIR